MEPYQLRGNRVDPLDLKQIQSTALNVCHFLNFQRPKRRKAPNFDKVFESLSKFSVTLNVIDEQDWLELTRGHFDPATLTISIPGPVYEDACLGDPDALFIVLHELGHLFLGHKALLHSSREPATQAEDAEWQADTFADTILTYLGLSGSNSQLSFDFYMFEILK